MKTRLARISSAEIVASAARLNGFDFSFTPYTGVASLPSGTTQLTLRQAGGFLLTDTTGTVFTGRDPGAGVVTRNGINYPIVTAAGDPGLGKIAIDPGADGSDVGTLAVVCGGA